MQSQRCLVLVVCLLFASTAVAKCIDASGSILDKDDDPACLHKATHTNLDCKCAADAMKFETSGGLLEPRSSTGIPSDATRPFFVTFRTVSLTSKERVEQQFCCVKHGWGVFGIDLVCGCPHASPKKITNFAKDYSSALTQFAWRDQAKKGKPFDLVLTVTYFLTSKDWMDNRVFPILSHLYPFVDLANEDDVSKAKFVLTTARYFIETDLQAREVLAAYVETTMKLVPAFANLVPIVGPAAAISCNLLLAGASMIDPFGKRDHVYTLALIDGLRASVDKYAADLKEFKQDTTGSAKEPHNYFKEAIQTNMFEDATNVFDVQQAVKHHSILKNFMMDKALLSDQFLLVQALNYVFKLRGNQMSMPFVSPYASVGSQLLEAMKTDLNKLKPAAPAPAKTKFRSQRPDAAASLPHNELVPVRNRH